MKHILCTALVFILLVGDSLAEESSAVMEYKWVTNHTGTITSVAFSADGKKVVTGDAAKLVKIWDVESGEKLKMWTISAGSLRSIDISPDGKKITVGSASTVIHRGNEREQVNAKPLAIYDADAGHQIQWLGRADDAMAVAFSPDGKKIVAGGLSGTAVIWDVESGEELKKLEGHARTVVFAAFSPDGKKIITSSHDKTTKIWDAESGEELQRLEQSFRSIAFSPDGKKIATSDTGVSEGNAVRIWDVESGKMLQELVHVQLEPVPGGTRDIDKVFSVAFSPDGKKIAAGYGNGVVRIWDVDSSEQLLLFENGRSYHEIYSIAFSPDGKKVAMGGGYVLRVLDWERVPPPFVRPAILDF